MINNPKISINIVTYNRDKYLLKAIDSVLAQDFLDWELIIVDDGSTDNTYSLVKKYQIKYKQIKYIKNEINLGIVKSRNKALNNSTGKYIAVLDSDDIWCNSNKLSKQYEVLEKENMVLVGGGIIEIDSDDLEKNKYFNPVFDEIIRKKILYRNPFAHSTTVFNRMLAIKIGGYRDFAIGEDYDLFLRLGLLGKMKNIRDYFVKYRIHKQNECSRKKVIALKNNLEIIKEYKGKYPRYFYAFLRRTSRLFIGYLIFR